MLRSSSHPVGGGVALVKEESWAHLFADLAVAGGSGEREDGEEEEVERVHGLVLWGRSETYRQKKSVKQRESFGELQSRKAWKLRSNLRFLSVCLACGLSLSPHYRTRNNVAPRDYFFNHSLLALLPPLPPSLPPHPVSSEMPVLTFVARASDSLLLVASFEHTNSRIDTDSLDMFKSQAKQLLKTLNSQSMAKCSVESGTCVFHYTITNDIIFLTLTEKSYPKRLAFLYLDEIHEGFAAELERDHGGDWRNKVATAARPYQFIKFDKFIQRKHKEVRRRMRRKRRGGEGGKEQEKRGA